MDGLEQYEAYLRGEPINDELAAMREGIEAAEKVAPTPARPEIRDAGRELRRRERQALKEAVRSEGWLVVLRLQEKLDQTHEKYAISMSQENPLANRDRIAEAWAYRLMSRRAMTELSLLIEAELAELAKEDGR